MESVRLQIQTGGSPTPTYAGGTASAAIGLADVVCRAGRYPVKSVVSQFLRATFKRIAAGLTSVGGQSFSRGASGNDSGDSLPVPLYDVRGAPPNGAVVVPRGKRSVLSGFIV